MKPLDAVTVLQPKVRLIDPHINTDDKDILSLLVNIFEPLVKVNRGGDYVNGLAQHWELTEDALCWTFYLRNPVYFHNGEILTADDVVASINRILSPEIGGELGTQGIYRSYLGDALIEAADQYTVRINTHSPMADLLDFLSKFFIAPRNTLKDLPGRMIGTGPFVLNGNTAGQVVMTAFNQYWGGKPSVGRIIWREELKSSQRVEALLNKKADLISAISNEDAEKIINCPNTTLASFESSICTVFMFNHNKGVCTDRRVRQALNYGLDKEEIIQTIMKGSARILNGPLTALHFGYDSHTPVYPYDPQKAISLLAESGYPNGIDLVLDVPLVMPDEALALAENIAKQYERIHVRTLIKQFSDRPAYANMVRSKQIDDACCFDSSPLSTFQVLSDKFHSGLHGAWWQGYQNPEVDLLIDIARKTADKMERKKVYQSAYRMISGDAPWIFLYNPILKWGLSSTLEDWQPNSDGLIYLHHGI